MLCCAVLCFALQPVWQRQAYPCQQPTCAAAPPSRCCLTSAFFCQHSKARVSAMQCSVCLGHFTYFSICIA
jgi:hypothetical protein